MSRPETLTRGLADAVRGRGATLHEHRRVRRIRTAGAEWIVEADDGRQLVSEAVVVAAGYATHELLVGAGIELPLGPARGTSFTVRRVGLAPRHPLKLAEQMIACSLFDDAGAVRLSGTFDLGARGTAVDWRRLPTVVDQGLRYLASWRPTGVGVEWVGHRPTTPDDLPVIGPVPGRAGVFVSTGHGTLGSTTGALLAREIVGGTPQELLAPFRLPGSPPERSSAAQQAGQGAGEGWCMPPRGQRDPRSAGSSWRAPSRYPTRRPRGSATA